MVSAAETFGAKGHSPARHLSYAMRSMDGKGLARHTEKRRVLRFFAGLEEAHTP